MSLLIKLSNALNGECEENKSNTPDWIMAEFLEGCLDALHKAIKARDEWYGINPKPGQRD